MPYCSSWHVVPDSVVSCPQCGETIEVKATPQVQSARSAPSSSGSVAPPPGGFGSTSAPTNPSFHSPGFSTSVPSGFCSRCGAGMAVGAYACMSCGSPASGPIPPPPTSFCSHCGGQIPPGMFGCARCGMPMRPFGSPKDKTTAVLLAVFFGHWAWAYTFDRDKDKFWIGLAIWLVSFILCFVLIGFFGFIGLYIWVIIDIAGRPDSYFRNYPNG